MDFNILVTFFSLNLCFIKKFQLHPRTYGVMVSTLDFESNNPSSILGMSFFFYMKSFFFYIKSLQVYEFD
jgi:hypothetical protein